MSKFVEKSFEITFHWGESENQKENHKEALIESAENRIFKAQRTINK